MFSLFFVIFVSSFEKQRFGPLQTQKDLSRPFEMTAIALVVIPSEREESFPKFSLPVGERKIMNHFVVNLQFGYAAPSISVVKHSSFGQ